MTYHQQVLDFLTDTYGVTDAEITHHGGPHPKLRFTYADKKIHATLQRDRADDPSLFNMKRQDLRRLLGTPPGGDSLLLPAAKPKRTLETMTTDLNTAAALKTAPSSAISSAMMIQSSPMEQSNPPIPPVILGRFCCYKDRIKFIFPPQIAQTMKGQALQVRRLVGCNWRIESHPDKNRKVPQVNLHKVNWEFEVTDPELRKGLPLLGPSPAEYMLDGNKVHVKLLLDQTQPLARQRREAVESITPASTKPAQPASAAFPDLTTGDVTLTQMHAALEELRRIERLSLYRLVKLAAKDEGGERWAFRAPLIE